VPTLDHQHLAAIIASSDDAIISKDLKGTVTSWNAAAQRMFGYTAQEMIGKSIRMIIPADRQSEEDLVLGRITQGMHVEHFETVRQRKDGSLIPISLSVSPIRDDSGQITGASKIARDISDRKRAEEMADRANRRALFLAKVSETLTNTRNVQLTLKTIAKLAVPRIADWCGVDLVREDGTIERLGVAHVDPEKVAIAELVRQRYESPDSPYGPTAVIRTGKPAHIPEVTDEMIVAAAKGDEERIRIIRSLGLVSYMCVPMIANGRTYGALVLGMSASGRHYDADDLQFVQDVAARAVLAVENSQAYEQIDSANRLKDEFLGTLSHELRTPLNAVLGYARMVRTGTVTGDRASQAMEVIERNATTLAQIVEDVLDVSRIISGKTRLHVQPVQLPDVIRNAVETVSPAAEAKGVRVQTVFDPGAGPVSGDPERLQQVVWNLLSNAVKFTPRGGRVHLRLERVNSHVEIVVSDTGIGIQADFLPHIFERFRQADASLTRRHGGLGLGLAIARHIVEMHGGSIQAMSEGEGKGATFRLKLPLMIVHAEAAPESERVHPRALRAGIPVEVSSLTGIRVLAVDDDADALTLLREILEAAGASVVTAHSGPAALENLEQGDADVLIADLGMPAMDGFELIQRVRGSEIARVRNVRAAALTAYARSEDRARTLRNGFELHLAKPIDPTELIAAVCSLARRRE
jgi:PAS domain S-box-containing protein